ncbi:MAG: caspase family protein [Bacteroidetes bacterium]|nr:caspase family protein [Bacteroidota bacterium]
MIIRNTLLFLVVILLLKTGAVFGQKCISNKKAREIQLLIDSRKFYDAVRFADNMLSIDSACRKAIFYRAIAYYGLRDSVLCLKDLNRLSTSSVLEPNELELMGDYADTLQQFDLAMVFYDKSYKTNNKKPGSVYLKGLKARYKRGEVLQSGGDRIMLIPVLDSCLKAEIRPAWVYREVLKLKADALKFKYEEFSDDKNRLDLGQKARFAYMTYLKELEPYLGSLDSLPQKMRSKEFCEDYFFIAARYTDYKKFSESKKYLSYMKQSGCTGKWMLLRDSLSYINYILQGDFENAAPVVVQILNRNPHSLFFLREQFKIFINDSIDYSSAILPLLKAIELYPDDSSSLILAANFYEKQREYKKALHYMEQIRKYHGEIVYEKDYFRIKEKLYESEREYRAPEFALDDSFSKSEYNRYKKVINHQKKQVLFKGHLTDDHEIQSLEILKQEVDRKRVGLNTYSFEITIDIPDTVTVVKCIYSDIYYNKDTAYVTISRLNPENSGKMALINPPGFLGEDINEVYIDSEKEKEVVFKGKIQSPYKIVNVTVNDSTASITDGSRRLYEFEARIFVAPEDTIVNVVYEIEGEEKQTLPFRINKKDAKLSKQQVSGRTWVVIISNAIYDNWPDLEGVSRDVNSLSSSLEGYQVQKVLRKYNLKEKEMRLFLTKDLKRRIEDAQVKTLILWYAGHGEFNEIERDSYWIPVDAKKNQEAEGYFSLTDLQQSLNNIDGLSNLLVISDACETALAFIDTKRGSETFGTCEQYDPEPGKSYNFLAAALNDKTSDKSILAELFSEYLATALKKTSNCVNLLDIANKVQAKLLKDQDAQFGQLNGIEQRKNPSFFLEKKK